MKKYESVKLLAPAKNFYSKDGLFFNIRNGKLNNNFQEPKTLLPPKRI